MKYFLTFALLFTGCTTFKRDEKGFQYRNGIFAKQISRAKYVHVISTTTNYYYIELEGYKSDAAQTIDSLTSAFQTLMGIPVTAAKTIK